MAEKAFLILRICFSKCRFYLRDVIVRSKENFAPNQLKASILLVNKIIVDNNIMY